MKRVTAVLISILGLQMAQTQLAKLWERANPPDSHFGFTGALPASIDLAGNLIALGNTVHSRTPLGAINWVRDIPFGIRGFRLGDALVDQTGSVFVGIALYNEYPIPDQTLVQKLSSGGKLLWSYDSPFAGSGGVSDLNFDLTGNLLFCGAYGYAGYITKLSTGGDVMWSRLYSDGGGTIGSISVDRYDNVYALGSTQARRNDCYLRKLSPAGELLWSRSYDFGLGLYDGPIELLLDDQDHPYVVAISETQRDEFTNTDTMVLKYSPDGDLLWQARFGSPFRDDMPPPSALGLKTFYDAERQEIKIIINDVGYFVDRGRVENAMLARIGTDGTVIGQHRVDLPPAMFGALLQMAPGERGSVYIRGYIADGYWRCQFNGCSYWPYRKRQVYVKMDRDGRQVWTWVDPVIREFLGSSNGPVYDGQGHLYESIRTTIKYKILADFTEGDANLDGCIDDKDLLTVLLSWGSNGWGDFNRDGIVDDQDLSILLENFGLGCGK